MAYDVFCMTWWCYVEQGTFEQRMQCVFSAYDVNNDGELERAYVSSDPRVYPTMCDLTLRVPCALLAQRAFSIHETLHGLRGPRLLGAGLCGVS